MSKNVLPIDTFRDEIMACDSKYIIIEAETGSGKSTQVPQWFLEQEMSVLVTEPLIETVIGTAEFVAQQVGCELGTTVGYRTGQNRCDSLETKIFFATSGLAMVRELSGHNQYDVLVIDELHQWNTNQSTLEAWAWKALQDGTLPFQKIVVLSATIDSTELSKKRGNAPIFKVPGRSFPIVDQEAGFSIVDDVKRLVEEDYDVLVFQPGKREIEEMIFKLQLLGINAELLPFHGELERMEKDKVYRSYLRPKVVISTNALETGRTLLPSEGRKLAVVDSGMERRIELRNGVETLVFALISQAQAKQRRGRTGRVSEGVYIDHCSSIKRSEYPTPEILRTRLDQAVLRLAVVGFDALELPFFHELDSATVADAKRSLWTLGAMTKEGKVTNVGRKMSHLPVSVQFARMIVEAQKLGVLDDVITIASILEQGGINDRSNAWRELVQDEKESDLIAQLRLWQAAQKMSNSQMKEKGIHVGAFRRVQETRRKLVEALRLKKEELVSTSDRESILRACVAGMVDHLFRNDYGRYLDGDSNARELGRESVIARSKWIVGMPKGIQYQTRFGLTTKQIVVMATKVEPLWLAEVAPQLVSIKQESDYWYDSEKAMVVISETTTFNGQPISSKAVQAPKCAEATEVLINSLVSCSTGHQAEEKNTTLQYAIGQLAQRDERVQLFEYDQLVAHYRQLVGDSTTFAEIVGLDLTVNPAGFVPVELLPELSKCELIGKQELTLRAEGLYQQMGNLRWSLPYGELSSAVSNMYYNYPSLVPVKMVPWMIQAQNLFASAEEELGRIEAARKERELRADEARRLAELRRLECERRFEGLQTEAQDLKEQAIRLLDSEKYEFFSDKVYEELERIENTLYFPYNLEGLQQWVKDAKAVIAEAEATEVKTDSGPVSEDAMANLLAAFGGDVRR